MSEEIKWFLEDAAKFIIVLAIAIPYFMFF